MASSYLLRQLHGKGTYNGGLRFTFAKCYPVACLHYLKSKVSQSFGQPRNFISTVTPPLDNGSQEQWNKVITDAENVLSISCPHPFEALQLESLLQITKEVDMELAMRNPVLKNLKHLINMEQSNMQVREIITLLMANIIKNLCNANSETANRQSYVATAGKLIYCSLKICNVTIEVDDTSTRDDRTLAEFRYGNKIVTLLGDYLLAKSHMLLTNTSCPQVLYNMSIGIRETVNGEYIFEKDKNGNAFPSETTTMREWETGGFYSTGSLIANSCKCAMILGEMDASYQKHAFEFGKLMGLAWHVSQETKEFSDACFHHDHECRPFSLVTSPIILQLQKDRRFFDLVAPRNEAITTKDYKNIHTTVKSGTAIQEAKAINSHYIKKALAILQEFPPSTYRTALENITSALEIP